MTASSHDKLNILAILIAETEHHCREQAQFIAKARAVGEQQVSSEMVLRVLEQAAELLRERQQYLQAGGMEH